VGEHTAISWCDSTLNLMMGCDGCELWNGQRKSCYAGVMTERYTGPGSASPKVGWPLSFGAPLMFPERLDEALKKWPDLTGKPRDSENPTAAVKPWLDELPRIIFLNDMGDTFTESLPSDWLAPALPRMAQSPHRWLVLTKRAARAKRFFELYDAPQNLWLGVSVTDQATADARIPPLLNTPGLPLRFVSAEPLLGPIVLEEYLQEVDWVIVGGESGPGYRPMRREWATDLMRQCRDYGVPGFFKQDSGPRTEMITGAMLAREMPEVEVRVRAKNYQPRRFWT
jgi:protein gp37